MSHYYADNKKINGISNYNNVISNMIFIYFGIYYSCYMYKYITCFGCYITIIYDLLCYVLFIKGLGSIIYHLNPNDTTYNFDKIANMLFTVGFLSLELNDFYQIHFFEYILFTCIIIYIYSTITNNLTIYILWQLFPIIVYCFSKNNINNDNEYYVKIIILITFSGFFDFLDKIIYDKIGISGHSISHIIDAFSMSMILELIIKRYMKDI